MSSSDETTTHEQLTETRSWSEYDEDGNVTADHTTVRAICGTCYRERIDRHGHLEYVSADWPCPEVENARLRERVAALEGAGTHALDGMADIACVHGRAFDSNEYSDWDSYCSVCAAMRPLAAALAQAGEGGAA